MGWPGPPKRWLTGQARNDITAPGFADLSTGTRGWWLECSPPAPALSSLRLPAAICFSGVWKGEQAGSFEIRAACPVCHWDPRSPSSSRCLWACWEVMGSYEHPWASICKGDRQGVHLFKPSLSLRASKAPSEVRLCQSQVPETPSDKALQIHLHPDAGSLPSLPSDATDVSNQVLSPARAGNTQDQ